MSLVRVFSLLSILLASSVAAADPIKVAVVVEVEVNVDSSRADALAQDLADALETELEVEAVGGLEVRRALPPEGLPQDCRAIQQCSVDVAKRLGVNQILFVVMVDTGGLQIDSTWVDVSSNRQITRPAVVVGQANPAEAKVRFAAAAKQLLPDAPVRPKAKVDSTPIVGPSVKTVERPAVPRHFTTPAKITAGAAVVGAGVGIVFGIRARGSYNDCNAMAPTCPQGDRDAIRRDSLIADGGFFLAAAGAVATGILFATSGKEARVVVEPSPTGVALSAVGRF